MPMGVLIPSAAGSFRRTARKPAFRVVVTDPQQTGYRHAGKRGTAHWGSAAGGRTVAIRLDDGHIVYGTDCWWSEIFDRPLTAADEAPIIDGSPAAAGDWELVHWDQRQPNGRLSRGRFRTRKDGLRARCTGGHNTRCCVVILA